MSLAGISPMSIIEPPPATGGTLPGLVQYLNNWLLGNDYQACTALTSDCLTISRANFDYSYLSLILNLIQAPNALDLDGNRPANHLTLLGAVHSDSYIQLGDSNRSEEHTSELQSLMRISYAVFCLKKKTKQT